MYKNDPRWITAKYGKCKECGCQLKGKKAFYYPKTREIFCEKCGEKHSKDFDSACFDQMVWDSQKL
jgi:hypothetical protein